MLKDSNFFLPRKISNHMITDGSFLSLETYLANVLRLIWSFRPPFMGRSYRPLWSRFRFEGERDINRIFAKLQLCLLSTRSQILAHLSDFFYNGKALTHIFHKFYIKVPIKLLSWGRGSTHTYSRLTFKGGINPYFHQISLGEELSLFLCSDVFWLRLLGKKVEKSW